MIKNNLIEERKILMSPFPLALKRMPYFLYVLDFCFFLKHLLRFSEILV